MQMRLRTWAPAAVVLLAVAVAGCGAEAAPREGAGSPARDTAREGEPCPASPSPDGPSGAPSANTPEARALADALAPPKRGSGPRAAYYDTYSSMEVDRPRGRVTLCVTDLERGRAWVAAVREAHPEADTSRVDLRVARWSKKEVDAAGERVLKKAKAYEKEYGFPLRTVSFDGATGLTVGTSAAGAASEAFRERLAGDAGGVPVRVVEREPIVAEVG